MEEAATEDLPEQASGDPWAAFLAGQELVPAYLVSRFAAQYRVIVDVLLAAQDTSLTGLSFDDVGEAIRDHLHGRGLSPQTVATLLGDEQFHLDTRLEQLERWRVVTRWQEPARTGEDFLRRRDRYQLTPLAARLHGFWSSAGDADEDESSDLTLAPRAIHDRLVAFAEAVRGRRYPAAASEFQQVSTLHQAMARAARTWQRSLAYALSGGPDQAKQELLWRTLQSYVGMWGEQVDVYSPRISGLIGELGPELTGSVWRACVRAALSDDTPDDLVTAQAARWGQTWTALGSWFAGADGQARRLRRQLRDLVAPWARNMHILIDTGGAVTRQAEMLRLAEAIERAPDDETAWRIWDTAVGIFPARHLLLPADAAEDHSLPWDSAPPAPVVARFREQGTRAAVGRRAKTPDYTTGRSAARRSRAAAAAARAEAEAGLRQRSGTRLAEWGPLTRAELDLLLDLVGVSRRAPGGAMPAAGATWSAGATRSAVTGDGRWRITLTDPAHAGDTATLDTPDGGFTTTNWRFDLEPA